MPRPPKPKEAIDTTLPALTVKQLNYVRCRLDGMNRTQAYRSAYNTENMADRTIWEEASKLDASPKVTMWLTTARQQDGKAAKLTHEQHIANLDELRRAALETGNLGAAVKAEELKAKASGLYVLENETENRRTGAIEALAKAIGEEKMARLTGLEATFPGKSRDDDAEDSVSH